MENLARSLEAVVFAASGPATVSQIRRALPELTAARIAELVQRINASLDREGRPYEIAVVAGGYQFRTRPQYGDVIRMAQPERKVRLSRAALETLSVIAYRQPVTRAEIEALRCVDCGAVIRGLLDRGLARIVGRRDAPGRPALYGTSAAFLETFGLASLRDLPELREILAMEETGGTRLIQAATEEVAPEATPAEDPAGAMEGGVSPEQENEPGQAESDSLA